LVETIEKHLNFEEELEKLNFWTYKMLEEEFMCVCVFFFGAFCKFLFFKIKNHCLNFFRDKCYVITTFEN